MSGGFQEAVERGIRPRGVPSAFKPALRRDGKRAIDRFVAIKLLDANSADEVVNERFFREARAAGSLRHPNIVVIGADVVLPRLSVSRFHAAVTIDDDGIHVEDLNSDNGTRVNGETIHDRRKIKLGDLLVIGDAELRSSDVLIAAAGPRIH